MATDSEALDMIESKIRELELRVYGEGHQPREHFNPVLESLLQANTIMTTAISGMEKFSCLFRRLKELNNYLEMNPVADDPAGLVTKLNVILSMRSEYERSAELLDKVAALRDVLDDDRMKAAESLRSDLVAVIASQLSKRERLEEINQELCRLLENFNEICLEISKSFHLFNEAITKLENSAQR